MNTGNDKIPTRTFLRGYIRPILLALFFLSGACGLIYEVAWTRMLTFVFGSTVLSVSTVLAAFMAGLALGSFSFGRLIDRRGDALKVYAYLEGGIGLFGLLLPTLLKGLSPLYVGMSHLLGDSYTMLSLARFVLCFALLVIPTTMMGGTLPVLSKFFVHRRAALGWNVGVLYAINTFGAVIGCFSSGFLLIGVLGVVETVYVAALTNLFVAAGTMLLRRSLPRPERSFRPERKDRRSARASAPGMAVLILWAFGLSGFVALGYEVIWSRVLVFFVGNSTYAFSAMLTTFLLGLALGSFPAGRISDKWGDLAGTFGLVEVLIGLSSLMGMQVLSALLAPGGIWAIHEQVGIRWSGEVGRMFGTSFAVMFVPTLLMGATFPIASKAYARSMGKLGRDIGLVYSANTVGAILGAFVSGFIVLPWLGVQGSIVLLASINGGVGLTVLLASRPSRRALRFLAAPGLAIVVFALGIFLPPQFVLRSDYEAEGDEVLFYQEDRAGTVKVYRKPDDDLFMSVDGNTIGATEYDLDEKQRLLAHLPLLLGQRPRSALVIGLGSGITAGAMTQYKELERIDCVEIVPSVVEGAAYFRGHNEDVLENPIVKVTVGDGINYLLMSDRKYDVISSDAKLNPAYTGNAVFLSSDYYRLCLERLSEGGMMCQWIPLHLPEDDYRMVLRTFAGVFPYGTLWFFPGEHTILVGTKGMLEIDFKRMQERMQSAEIQEDLARFGLDDPLALLSGYRGDRTAILQYVGSGRINSWNHPYIEFHTPRDFARTPMYTAQAYNLKGIGRIAGDVLRHLIGVPEAEVSEVRGKWAQYARSTELLLGGLIRAKETNVLSYGEELFRESLRVHPEDARAKYWLARSIRERERILGAPESRPKDARAYILLGNNYLAQDEYEKAREAFQWAIRIEPENAIAHYNLGVTYEYNGEGLRYGPGFPIDRAIGEHRRAIEIDGHYVEAYYNLGVVYQYNREGIRYGPGSQIDRAVEAFKSVLEIAPKHASAYNNLGAAYLQKRRYVEARQAWEQALDADPNHPSARANLTMLRRMGF